MHISRAKQSSLDTGRVWQERVGGTEQAEKGKSMARKGWGMSRPKRGRVWQERVGEIIRNQHGEFANKQAEKGLGKLGKTKRVGEVTIWYKSLTASRPKHSHSHVDSQVKSSQSSEGLHRYQRIFLRTSLGPGSWISQRG